MKIVFYNILYVYKVGWPLRCSKAMQEMYIVRTSRDHSSINGL
jgi:hypothetical protein